MDHQQLADLDPSDWDEVDLIVLDLIQTVKPFLSVDQAVALAAERIRDLYKEVSYLH